jgi:hypothetical protein
MWKKYTKTMDLLDYKIEVYENTILKNEKEIAQVSS